jgi:hypothetical protein
VMRTSVFPVPPRCPQALVSPQRRLRAIMGCRRRPGPPGRRELARMYGEVVARGRGPKLSDQEVARVPKSVVRLVEHAADLSRLCGFGAEVADSQGLVPRSLGAQRDTVSVCAAVRRSARCLRSSAPRLCR